MLFLLVVSTTSPSFVFWPLFSFSIRACWCQAGEKAYKDVGSVKFDLAKCVPDAVIGVGEFVQACRLTCSVHCIHALHSPCLTSVFVYRVAMPDVAAAGGGKHAKRAPTEVDHLDWRRPGIKWQPWERERQRRISWRGVMQPVCAFWLWFRLNETIGCLWSYSFSSLFHRLDFCILFTCAIMKLVICQQSCLFFTVF